MRSRSTKQLSLALCLAAVFVAALLAPAGASAFSTIHSSAPSPRTTVEGTQSGVAFKVGNGPVSVTCNSSTFSGTMFGSEAETLMLHPVYNKEENTCSAPPFGATTAIRSSGCEVGLVWVPEETGPPGGVSIICEAGKAIEIVMPECTVKIGEQALGGGFHYTNTGSWPTNKLKASVEASGISYTASGKYCALAKIPTSGTNGSWTNTVELSGYIEEKGTQTPLWSGSLPSSPRSFHSEGNTVLHGSYEGASFWIPGTAFNKMCGGGSSYNGSWGLNGSAEMVGLEPTPYINCGAQVTTAGCSYVLAGDFVSPEAPGTSGISCKEGGAIQLVSMSCTVRFGPQAGLSSATYVNHQSGGPSTRTIAVTLNLEGVPYTATGAGCPSFGKLPASGSNAHIGVGFTISATVSKESGPAGVWIE